MKVLETKTKPNGDVWVLQEYGTHAPWYGIIKTVQNGVSLMNEYGGYTTQHVGSKKYIDRLWKKF